MNPQVIEMMRVPIQQTFSRIQLSAWTGCRIFCTQLSTSSTRHPAKTNALELSVKKPKCFLLHYAKLLLPCIRLLFPCKTVTIKAKTSAKRLRNATSLFQIYLLNIYNNRINNNIIKQNISTVASKQRVSGLNSVNISWHPPLSLASNLYSFMETHNVPLSAAWNHNSRQSRDVLSQKTG